MNPRMSLLNRTIDILKNNKAAQAGAGALGAYVGAHGLNAISPIDIDPEAAAVAGAFAAPMLRQRMKYGKSNTVPDPWMESGASSGIAAPTPTPRPSYAGQQQMMQPMGYW